MKGLLPIFGVFRLSAIVAMVGLSFFFAAGTLAEGPVPRGMTADSVTAEIQPPNGATQAGLECDGNAPGMANPAAVYCHELGYEYNTVDTDQGQYGICVFPDRSECGAWGFLEGKCGQAYSYCARQGYEVTTKTDGKNPISSEYSVCVHDQREIGPVTDLMGLPEKATRGTFPVQQSPSSPEREPGSAESLPSSFSWRSWMSPVKNQGICGSCWAMSAVGVVEAMYNIRRNTANLDLSEEYLVSDCYAADNCCGGWNDEALTFIRNNGIPDESCLLYVDGSSTGCSCTPPSTCHSNCTYRDAGKCSDKTCSDRCSNWQLRLRKVSATGPVANTREAIKEKLVTVGPLAVNMCDGDDERCGGSYDSNRIYKCDPPPLEVTHAVVIVGYNDADEYWIVKNSWGIGFEDGGYFKVGYGQCLIEESRVSYAGLPLSSPVGGIAELPHVSDSSAGNYVALAAAIAAAVVALSAGAWYARRRWSR